jgi:hypothetical protein
MEEYADFRDTQPSITLDNPLRVLFHQLVERAFADTLGWAQAGVNDYLANLLTDFAHRDDVYRIQDMQGTRLQSVVEMLMEAETHALEPTYDRERTVHKHIGDFTLFWTGLYPEALRKMRGQGRADHLINYVRQGKQSYYIVSTFQHGPYAEDADLFRELSDRFELCLFGLSLVRREWERLALSPGRS